MKSAAVAAFAALLIIPGVCHAQGFEKIPPPVAHWQSSPSNSWPVPAPAPELPPMLNMSDVGSGDTALGEAFLGGCHPGGMGRYERFHFRASYLNWWINRDDAPLPVVTTSLHPAGLGGGALDQPDTLILLRAGDVGRDGPYSGGEFGFHYWLDPNQWLGLDGRFFFLQRRTGTAMFAGDATGSPLLSIPFTDLNPVLPGPSFTQIANPGASTGQVVFESSTRLWGLEASADLPSFGWNRLAVSSLIGFRYLDLAENYGIVQDVVSVGGQPLLSFQGNPIPGTDSLRITDTFDTRNLFYGANFILRADYQLTPALALNLTSRTALGTTRHILDVHGSTLHLTATGQPPVAGAAPGGLFAQPNIIGRRTGSSITVIPEVEARLAWAVTSRIEVNAGYNFLYWHRVLRPASQIPDTINTTTAPSQATFGTGGVIPPPPDFRFSSLLVHGFNVGLMLRY